MSPEAPPPADFAALPPPAPPPPRRRRWTPVVLLAATVATTMVAGHRWYVAFLLGADGAGGADAISASWVHGAWYSLTILAILGMHELGHYYACRYYGLDVSPPYFVPAPVVMTGTLGAFIRIRQRIPTKPMLFDIGAAGPIAGFVVAVPALFLGLALSRVVPLSLAEADIYLEFGEPLLFRAAAWLVWGDLAPGHAINLHPVGFAAWFGLLATTLNLFPIGQLDGGHIAYAALGARSTALSVAGVAALVGLCAVSLIWVPWTVLLMVMLVALGPRHPRTADDAIPLDRRRKLWALGTAVIFVLCFTPVPIRIGGGGPPA